VDSVHVERIGSSGDQLLKNVRFIVRPRRLSSAIFVVFLTFYLTIFSMSKKFLF
jgi:hypothetical protein